MERHVMALSLKARKRSAIVILLVGLPVYVVVAISVLSWFDRPPILLELLIYILLGMVWALPFKSIFRGVGRADPSDAGNGG